MGYIQEKLDIKILLLFILQKLPRAVSADELAQLSTPDAGINYFDFAECLHELIDTGHVEAEGTFYRISEKGRNHVSVVESTLPYSLRSKAERAAESAAEAMRRGAMISASRELSADGSAIVSLSLSDGRGSVLSMNVLASGEEQAERMEKNFRTGAEQFYLQIVGILSGDGE